jgi:hypothetical protein
MVEQQSKRTKTADASRVEYLLGVLSGLSQHDPSPALRECLGLLSSERLRDGSESGKWFGRAPSGLLPWLRPVLVVSLIIALGMATSFVVYFRPAQDSRAAIESRDASPRVPLRTGSRALPEAPPPKAKSSQTLRLQRKLAQNTTTRRMIVWLPYSDRAIDTGTDATIRISVSQAELVSLGFPMNTTLQDRMVVADLTLGDDGLPRAISVPLPLEVIKGKK